MKTAIIAPKIPNKGKTSVNIIERLSDTTYLSLKICGTQGRLGKFLKENTLFEQQYIMSESKELVKDVLKAKGVKIDDFRRITLSAE